MRLGQDLDLLDAPGVLPRGWTISRRPCTSLSAMTSARPPTAANWWPRPFSAAAQLEAREASGVIIGQLEGRYGVALAEAADPAFWLEAAAARHLHRYARMAQRLLDDFRKSTLGSIALELPA